MKHISFFSGLKMAIKAAAIVIVGGLFSAPAMAASAQANSDPSADMLETFGCDALGGTTAPQPAGSNISWCCFPDTCYICDSGFKNCDAEPSGGGKPGGSISDRLTNPVLETGTMSMPNGTNTTTTGPSTAPLNNKLIRRNVIRK